VISHRTNAGSSPSNSLAGILAALDDGAEAIEIDVRATVDGVPALLHDPTFVSAAGATYRLAETPARSLAEIALRDPHGEGTYRIPTLRDAIPLLGDGVRIVLDIKVPGLSPAVSALVRTAGLLDRCLVWAFDPAVTDEYRMALPEAEISLLVDAGSMREHGYGSYLDVAAEQGLAGVSLHHPLVSAEVVEAAHRRGLLVYAWTVDEEADLRRVHAARVDGICTDHPAWIIRALGDGGSSVES